MTYYSQCGQDKIVDDIFRGLNHGYFVDIGASDGIVISNTYFLEKERKWEGLCIDPHNGLFEKLKLNRQCILDNSFVWKDGGESDYIEFLEGENVFFSGATPYPAYCNNKKIIRRVPTVSLYSLFEKLHVPTVIHYMSLDVEGLELDILKDYFDKEYSLTKTSFYTRHILTLSVEHNFIEPFRSNLRDLLINNDFMFHAELMHDDFYVHKVMDIML